MVKKELFCVLSNPDKESEIPSDVWCVRNRRPQTNNSFLYILLFQASQGGWPVIHQLLSCIKAWLNVFRNLEK